MLVVIWNDSKLDLIGENYNIGIVVIRRKAPPSGSEFIATIRLSSGLKWGLVWVTQIFFYRCGQANTFGRIQWSTPFVYFCIWMEHTKPINKGFQFSLESQSVVSEDRIECRIQTSNCFHSHPGREEVVFLDFSWNLDQDFLKDILSWPVFFFFLFKRGKLPFKLNLKDDRKKSRLFEKV